MNDFYLEKTIYYHDTDAGGVVYYGAYLKHFEEARTEYFRSLGINLAEYAKNGIIFPVVHLEIDYKSPARYGDKIRVFIRPEKIGRASLEFAQEIKKDDTTLVIGKVVWACVNKDLNPVRIPENIRSKLEISGG
ncbi:MAG: YbgC/FadM family acyl-CoA thioesterase [Candidatus Omnitrophica bacterium]|nr:YbgC/FadM family acyl-CoA thioesterase [Candidatus Omnitrophota bacterium]